MKKKDIFFASLFTVSFVVSAVVMAGDYLCKELEGNLGISHWLQNREQTAEWQEDRAETQEINGPEETQNGQQQGQENEAGQIISSEAGQVAEAGPGKTEQGSDPETGKTAETETVAQQEPLEFETVAYDYFDDALFIGDSRTVGIMEYGELENATFFADSGMSVYGLDKKKISVPNVGKVTFDEILEGRQYGKVYLMLGINELGYQFESTGKKYQETVARIREHQKQAIIFLCANMHVTDEQSGKDEIYNNANIDRMNELIASLADNETIFYIDVNELFDDESGSLSEEYSSDAFHVLGKYYVDWVDWLCTKGIAYFPN